MEISGPYVLVVLSLLTVTRHHSPYSSWTRLPAEVKGEGGVVTSDGKEPENHETKDEWTADLRHSLWLRIFSEIS